MTNDPLSVPDWLLKAHLTHTPEDDDIYQDPVTKLYALWGGPDDDCPILGIPTLEMAQALVLIINAHYDRGYADGFCDAFGGEEMPTIN